MKRQQLVLKIAVQEVFSGSLFDNPLDTWDALNKLVQTDVPRSKVPGYALLVQQTQGSLSLFSLGDPVGGVETVHDETTPAGASVLTWNADNVQYWFDRLLRTRADPVAAVP